MQLQHSSYILLCFHSINACNLNFELEVFVEDCECTPFASYNGKESLFVTVSHRQLVFDICEELSIVGNDERAKRVDAAAAAAIAKSSLEEVSLVPLGQPLEVLVLALVFVCMFLFAPCTNR